MNLEYSNRNLLFDDSSSSEEELDKDAMGHHNDTMTWNDTKRYLHVTKSEKFFDQVIQEIYETEFIDKIFEE